MVDLKKIWQLLQGSTLADTHEIPVSENNGPGGTKKYNIGQLKSYIWAFVQQQIGNVTQGPQGPQGAPGAQGVQGPKGEKGNPGDKGDTGLKGDSGPQGAQGIQGITGEKGEKGDPGPQGIQGIQGEKGDQGEQGEAGQIVLAGEDTNLESGPVDPTSADGVDGDFYINTTTNFIFGPKAAGEWPSVGVNLVGPQGPQGPQGVQGPAGIDGAQGPQGPAGPQGIQGVQGIQGLPGADGATGPQGLQGVPGTDGVQGPQGPQGEQGVPGATGPQGLQGVPGPPGPGGGGPETTDQLQEGENKLYFTQSRVLNTVLTGFTVGSAAAIAATDTVLAAFRKIQALINGKQDALVSGTNIKTINGSSILGGGDIEVATVVPDATPTVKGVSKLYTDANSANTDGAVNQATVKAIRDEVAAISQDNVVIKAFKYSNYK